jgi:hypothetical protein
MPSTRSTTSGAGSGRLPPAAPSVGGRQPFAIAASGKLGLGGRCWLSPISMLPLYLPLSSPPTRLPPPLRSGEGSRLLSQLPGSLGSVGVVGFPPSRCCPCTCRCPRLPQGSRRPFGRRKAAVCYHSFREAWAPSALGQGPNPGIFGSLLRARRFLITLLEVRPETSPAGSLWDKVRVSGLHWAIRSRGTALSEAL